MAGALLYQPTQRWRIGAAFGAAALIHFAAIVLADRDYQTQVQGAPSWQDGDIPIEVLGPDAPREESTPPEDVATPAPIPVPVDQTMFTEVRTTLSPVPRQISKSIAPIAKTRSGVTSGTMSFSSVRALALSGPRPLYPYEARRQKITGSGIAMMTVDPATGNVIDVVMQESTGSPVLDNAAITAFRRWRFKTGTGPRVRSPITFTMTGAQY